ncbi:GAF domain-containing protein [Xylophilus rhododendri]|uniref:histidine kinase n=1 Tax=Xylophilus rhododendri TaxID=2697032 RepID=A0A857J872_9BURK|nr:ATP-binding protein [Xylophilus rhododendri]QHI99917.1 GAF domain-containing protein [Xylophilus rhododendri]
MTLIADIAACDREPIRVPGAIQPHGRLLALHGRTLALQAWSGNWIDAADARAAAQALEPQRLHSLPAGQSAVSAGELRIAGAAWKAWAHRSDDAVIVEFEPAQPVSEEEPPIYVLARDLLPQLQSARSVPQLLDAAAEELRQLTGFGRCLIYRFDAEGHGEVLAESLAEGYDSYRGHHFPASDIPLQARDLYLLNRFRLIPDARYQAVPLMAEGGLEVGRIDLSLAHLRSVSPVHLEYMRNMGTLASMSVSIVVDGKLWGLASCHDHDPRYLPPDVRAACSHLGQLLSMQVEAKEAHAEVQSRLELRKLTLEMVAQLSDADASLRGLLGEAALMLRIARATGAAVVLDEQVWTVGDTPPEADLLPLAAWVADLGQDVYESDRLAHSYPDAAPWREVAAGVLALSISRVHRHVIFWFRPEIVRTITWAGDPRKESATDATGRMHPRLSFSSWTQEIAGRCESWTPAEVGAAGELRQALIAIVLRRAEEMAAVAGELGRVNKELEAFSYTVSHDLRAPMRHIAGYVDLVMEAEGQLLSPRAHRYLGHVKDAAAFAGLLVDALLDFSRMGRSALKVRPLNTQDLVNGLVRELERQEADRPIEWHIEAGLPRLDADPVLLQVAVRNLLANAVKYSRKRTPAVITVRSVRREDGVGLEVEDNGVGFQMQYVNKLFGVFQRLHKTEDFEGTGIGLANVKRIVERHGGSVWARGTPNAGATFGFVLPPRGETPAETPTENRT